METPTPGRYVSPQFEASALITIDVQRDFLDGGACPIEGTSVAVPQMVRLAQAFRRARRPIIHVVRIYQTDGSNAELARREMLEAGVRIVTPGSPGMELAVGLPVAGEGLQPEILLAGTPQPLGPEEWALFKPRWGAFFATRLEEWLRQRDVSTLVFCGCNFPNCPRTSMYEASERDFRLVLAEDAISGLYERGRQELQAIGVVILGTEEIVCRVQAVAAAAQ